MAAIFISAISFTSLAFGDLKLAPPAFQSSLGKAVFVDFKSARHHLTVDLQSKKSRVSSVINFETKESGRPLFDSVNRITFANLDGESVEVKSISLPNTSTIMLIDKELSPGEYLLETEHEFNADAAPFFDTDGVRFAFNMSDLTERKFLEQYFPANLEFDQCELKVSVEILNASQPHMLIANGKVTEKDRHHWEIDFPDYYNSAMPWLHFGPESRYTFERATYLSVDGRDLPITLYGAGSIYDAKEITWKALDSLEAQYGAFPHDQLILYITGNVRGGMEYAGATATQTGSIYHELVHSYYARGVMPVGGEAGWIDEAIATWSTAGYNGNGEEPRTRASLGSSSPYSRKTDRAAYSVGADFISYIAWLFSQKSLKLVDLLRSHVQDQKFTLIRNSEFQNLIETNYGGSLQGLFDKFIYGRSNLNQERHQHIDRRELYQDHGHHRLYTNRDM